MKSRLVKRLLRTKDVIARQGKAVFKACLGLTSYEQIALALVLGLILLGLTTRFVVRTLGMHF